MGKPLYYDRKGRPLSVYQWAALYEANPDGYRFVARTRAGRYTVSTIWLGLDHAVWGDVPLIFETMILGADWFGDCLWRWPTEEAALAGHDQAVMAARSRIAL